jgi:polyhydroxyalkanoate synthesis regulator phasin
MNIMSNGFFTESRGNLFAPLMTRWTNDVGVVQRAFSKTNISWTKGRINTNVSVNPTHLACYYAISLGKYEEAINLMRSKIVSWCEVLAKAFNKNFEGKEYISDLIEGLKQDGKISKEEANRLLVILMTLDGLETEIREYEGEMDYKDLQYLVEFEENMERILKGKKVNIDISLLRFTVLDFATSYPEVMTISTMRQPTGISGSIDFSIWDNTNVGEIVLVP